MTAALLPRIVALVQAELDRSRPRGCAPVVAAESDLVADLRCCAVDYQCFAMDLDEAFGVEIPEHVLDDGSADRWRTPEDMARTVQHLLAARAPDFAEANDAGA